MTAEPYDFRKPGRPAGAVEQRLASWLRDFCALAPAAWAKHLAIAAHPKFNGLVMAWPDAALAQLPETALAYPVRVSGVDRPTLLVLPRPLLLALVAGALGDTSAELPADRELTVVEESVADYLMENLLFANLRTTWPGTTALQLTLQPRVANPRYARLFPTDGGVMVCSFAVEGPFGTQPWYWLLPQTGWLDQAAPAEQGLAGLAETAGASGIEPMVRELPVSLTVVLGTVELPLAQAGQLRAGDVLILGQPVAEPLTTYVAGEKKFRVWPGRTGSRQAVEIESLLG